MKIVYIIMVSLMILFIIAGFVLLVDIITLYSATNRVQDSITSAAWSGFTEVDLDQIARRHLITNEELRDTYLDKTKSNEKIKETIKENLKLDHSYYPEEESYLNLKSYPVKIEEMIIYNPNELPATAPNGKDITRTSVYIRLKFPIKLNFLGNAYKEVEVIVDTKTFYSKAQKERM